MGVYHDTFFSNVVESKSDILVGFHLVPNLQIAIWQLAFAHSTIDIPGYDDSPCHGQPRRRRLGFRRWLLEHEQTVSRGEQKDDVH